MKIVVLFASPNVHGSTSLLVESFHKGAREAGHVVEVIDVTKAKIHPCTGCVACGYEGTCVINDDMMKVRQKLLNSDMVLCLTTLLLWHDSSIKDYN